MWATVAACGLATFVTFLSAPPFGLMLAAATATVLLAAILHKRLSYRVGVGLLLAPLYAYALTILVRAGFVPNATSVFLMMAVVAALLLGSRLALALTAVATLTLAIVWVGHHVGALDSLRVPLLYVAATPDNWLGIMRISLIYACLSSVCVVAVSYLLGRAEAALSDKSRALEELRRNQVEAERLRDHLRQQDEAFAKARELEILGRLAGSVAHDFNNALLMMAPETQARLFEPYFTTKGEKGTGLGLSSVKSIVESHGGRIAVASQLGRGTKLSIFWPLAVEGVESPADALRASMPTSATVLVVDDDPRARSVVASVLRQRGFTVLEASDGTDALIVARRHRGSIDVLCSDCVMPGTPVRQMVESFREIYPNARVLLASGYAPEDVAPPLELIDAFLAKPFAPDAIVAMIGDLMLGHGPGRTRKRGTPPPASG
jgi:CheY-like chemotaxis protein